MSNDLTIYSTTGYPDEMVSDDKTEDVCEDCMQTAYENATAHAEALGLPRINGRGIFHRRAVLAREAILQEYEQWRVEWVKLPLEQVFVVFNGCYRLFCKDDAGWWMRVRSEEKTLIDLVRREFTSLELSVFRRPITSALMMRKRGDPLIPTRDYHGIVDGL